MTPLPHPKSWIAFGLFALLLVACGPNKPSTTDPSTGEAKSLDELLGEAQAVFTERMGELPTPPIREALETQLRAQLDHDSQADLATWSVYEEAAFETLILDHSKWMSDAEAVANTLGLAHQHALSREYPAPASFLEAKQQLDEMSAGFDELKHFNPTEEDWLAVADWAERTELDPSDGKALETLYAALSTEGEQNPMPRLGQRLATLAFLSHRLHGVSAKVEATLGLQLGRYASEMRLGHPDNTPQLNPFKKWAKKETRYRARVGAFFLHLKNYGAKVALNTLLPKHPMYPKLVEARQRYADIAAAGGWGEVSIANVKKLKRGKKNPGLSRLKERLAIEGYTVGTIDDVYDDDLVEAIKLYQDVHQMKVKSNLDQELIDNVNIPVEDRLAKIDVTLERYRKTLLGAFDYYIFINLPDFHAEVWQHGERKMRFRIVIGNNDAQRDMVTKEVVLDENNEIIRPNQTQTQNAFMEYIIYNPYWNVPIRIRTEELEPKVLENPLYYEENGFEIVNPDRPAWSYVRQLPGDDNALGRVKFIFPNPFETYLHDTNSRGLFKNPIRAFSHGCMRVQDPLDFAEFMLTQDGQWNAKQVQQILNTTPLQSKTYNLKTPVPVQTEYFNTRVDDSGQVAFLSDIYRRDKKAIDKRRAELEKIYAEANRAAAQP